MATRNLARTVIEVGRTSWSKEERKDLRRRERREARRFCDDAASLLDLDDLQSAPVRYGRGYEFAQDDKLGPARRWLDSRVGRPWDEVYSELSAKFRGRGIALSHVVDFHMLAWVDRGAERWWGSYDYSVDEDGILRRTPQKPRKRSDYRWRRMNEVDDWCDGRKVITRGRRCYWTRPDRVEYTDPFGKVRVEFTGHRQGPEFSPEDYAFWTEVGSYFRGRVSQVTYSLRD